MTDDLTEPTPETPEKPAPRARRLPPCPACGTWVCVPCQQLGRNARRRYASRFGGPQRCTHRACKSAVGYMEPMQHTIGKKEAEHEPEMLADWDHLDFLRYPLDGYDYPAQELRRASEPTPELVVDPGARLELDDLALVRTRLADVTAQVAGIQAVLDRAELTLPAPEPMPGPAPSEPVEPVPFEPVDPPDPEPDLEPEPAAPESLPVIVDTVGLRPADSGLPPRLQAQLITVAEAAAVLDVSVRTVHTYIEQGKLRRFKSGTAQLTQVLRGQVHALANGTATPVDAGLGAVL